MREALNVKSETWATWLERLLAQLTAACAQCYGERLVSLVVFGSVGRGTPRPDSDVDVLIVADDLPDGRLRRVAEFRPVENALAPLLAEPAFAGGHVELSPIFKTRAEVTRGTPLLLDLVDDARVLYDREDFMRSMLARLRARLDQLQARRIWQGNAWWWDLKPDYRVGEVFEI